MTSLHTRSVVTCHSSSILCHKSCAAPHLRTPAIFLLLLFPEERCLCHTGCLDRDIYHLEKYAAAVTSGTEDTSTTMLCWALSLAFQGRRVTSSQHSPSQESSVYHCSTTLHYTTRGFRPLREYLHQCTGRVG